MQGKVRLVLVKRVMESKNNSSWYLGLARRAMESKARPVFVFSSGNKVDGRRSPIWFT